MPVAQGEVPVRSSPRRRRASPREVEEEPRGDDPALGEQVADLAGARPSRDVTIPRPPEPVNGWKSSTPNHAATARAGARTARRREAGNPAARGLRRPGGGRRPRRGLPCVRVGGGSIPPVARRGGSGRGWSPPPTAGGSATSAGGTIGAGSGSGSASRSGSTSARGSGSGSGSGSGAAPPSGGAGASAGRRRLRFDRGLRLRSAASLGAADSLVRLGHRRRRRHLDGVLLPGDAGSPPLTRQPLAFAVRGRARRRGIRFAKEPGHLARGARRAEPDVSLVSMDARRLALACCRFAG